MAQRVVVLGGGFGGLESAYYLKWRLGDRALVTLVSDRPDFLFKPNTIYIPFGLPPEKLMFPIAPGAQRAGVTFVQARVEDVDPAKQEVITTRGQVPFDRLIIATGAGMRPEEIPGLKEHAVGIWTVDEMLRLRSELQRLVERALTRGQQHVLFLVPPSNKCSGPLYELVFMLDTWLRRKHARGLVHIVYTTYERTFIQAFGPRLHEVVTREFQVRGIEGLSEHIVTHVEAGTVHYTNGARIPFDLLITFPPYVAARPYTSLPSDDRGFVAAELETRRVQGHPHIYVAGDAADFPVKQAFLAFLQADAAAEQIAAELAGEYPRLCFEPTSMCVMEMFDKATFAQVPLRVTGDPQRPVEVRADALHLYKVGVSPLWRAGKALLGLYLPFRFRAGQPFHAGPLWQAMDLGLSVMSTLLAR